MKKIAVWAGLLTLMVVSWRAGLGGIAAAAAAVLLLASRYSPLRRPEGKGRSGRPTAAPPRAAPMSLDEAREILGIDESASREDIQARYRLLMKRLHPDRGGSPGLAARVNQAKDRLLGS